jgi:dTDP-4-dehydrorhamnose reductase
MKILVLGANGMIGSAMYRVLREKKDLSVWGTLRTSNERRFFTQQEAVQLIDGIDASHADSLLRAFATLRPDVVVNCVGLTKHRVEANDLTQNLELNATLPHRLTRICEVAGARLIHVSTDCVFLGSKGDYVEADVPDAQDFYGRSKSFGEVISAPHAITLRTSTIGHELHTSYGLLEWFLSQKGQCNGFSRAIFSGLPTVVFAQVVRDIVLPRPNLHGLYHLSSNAINKFDLLKLIAKIYSKSINIVPDESLVIDRSLNCARLSAETGYVAPDWEELVHMMHARAKGSLHSV